METWIIAMAGVVVAILANVVMVATSLGRMGAKLDLYREMMIELASRMERNAADHAARNDRDNAVIFERMDALNQRLSTLEGRTRGSDSH